MNMPAIQQRKWTPTEAGLRTAGKDALNAVFREAARNAVGGSVWCGDKYRDFTVEAWRPNASSRNVIFMNGDLGIPFVAAK
ncbi:MAG TPA: hypothetical protein VFH51_07755, partial [Myxococcota bacterium]|nr:hypothetical protein [Myxococcota bacterium]